MKILDFGVWSLDCGGARRALALVFLSALGCRAAVAGDSFAIRAKAVYTCTAEEAGPIENGVVIVRGGKIAAVGRDLEIPEDLKLIDLRDETLVPGFVNAAAALAGYHTGEKAHGAGFRALDAFDTYGDFEEELSRGTTTVHIDPGGHRIISGQGAVVKLAGEASRRVLRESSDIAVNFGAFDPPMDWKLSFYAAAFEAIIPGKRQGPDTRLGQFLELEAAILEGERWGQSERGTRGAGNGGGAGRGAGREYDYHIAAMAELWAADAPLRISVRRAADIDGAVRFLARHKRKGYLVGLTQLDKIGSGLVKAGVPGVLRLEESYAIPAGDLGVSPDVMEPVCGLTAKSRASKLALAGAEGSGQDDLRMIAAMALRGGMSERAALEGITRAAAEVLGVDDRVGSIAAGKDADFLVMTGPPLDINSSVRTVYVEGRKAFEAPHSDALVVRAGTIWVGNGQVINDASILVEKGKIAAVGRRVAHPPFAKIIDAGKDAFISPGFIDAHGHLGLEGDRSAVSADVPIAATIGAAGRNFARVARAGITTVMMAAYSVGGDGSRVAAIKTHGRGRDELVVRDVSAMKFSLRGKDPLLGVEEMRRVINAGKEYEQKWKKYDEELKKWQEEQAKGGAAEKKPAESEVTVKEEKPDPVSGTWSFTLSGGPMPENVTGTMTLRMTDSKIEGRMSVPGEPEEAKVSGTLSGNQVTLEIDQDTPFGKPKISATLDEPERMKGTVSVGEFSINFEATRTDKAPPEFRVSRKRGKGKGGRPTPPKVDEALEPVRQLLAQKIPALVDVQTAAQINSVLKVVVEEFKLPLVLLNAEEAELQAEKLAKNKVGVIVPPAPVRPRDRKAYNEAAELSLKGVSVAMQSDAEDGARNLGLMALFATQQGLGGDAALSALTIDAARMFRLEDRVGSLEAGKDGDLLIFSGHPFDAGSRLERVFVAGQEVTDEK